MKTVPGPSLHNLSCACFTSFTRMLLKIDNGEWKNGKKGRKEKIMIEIVATNSVAVDCLQVDSLKKNKNTQLREGLKKRWVGGVGIGTIFR